MEEKAAFVFDTNFIIQVKKLGGVVENLSDKFTVYVTQVSIDERIAQVCREAREKFDRLEDLKKEYSDIATITLKTTREDISAWYRKRIQTNYERVFGSNIIPFSKDEEAFSEILERAYQKQAPFLSDPKASDKGFKDALIWLSLLNFFKHNGSSYVVFISDDNGFKNNAKVLSEEFFEATGKTIEIKDNSYYRQLTEAKPEIKEPQILEFIPDIDQLREEIHSVIGNLCSASVENYYGDSWEEFTFTISEKFDASYIESVFKNIKNVISTHIFDQGVSASEVFVGNDQIANGKVDIPISALESAMRLYDKFCQKYPDYMQQFYFTTANILNLNYREASVEIDGDEELPF